MFREPYESNATLILNERDVVVVDGGSTPLTARRVIAALRKMTDKPVGALVNTHWHYDHVFGNQKYVAAYPGVEIVSHPEARPEMLERSAAFVSLPPQTVATIEAALRGGRDASGAALSAEDRRKHEDQLLRQAEMARFQLTPPTLTSRRSWCCIAARARSVSCTSAGTRQRGPRRLAAKGEDPGERRPDRHSDFVGLRQLPPTTGRRLRRLDALEFATLVPAHGEVQHDRVAVRLVSDALAYANGIVDAGVRGGASLEETRGRLELEPLVKRRSAADMRGGAFSWISSRGPWSKRPSGKRRPHGFRAERPLAHDAALGIQKDRRLREQGHQGCQLCRRFDWNVSLPAVLELQHQTGSVRSGVPARLEAADGQSGHAFLPANPRTAAARGQQGGPVLVA